MEKFNCRDLVFIAKFYKTVHKCSTFINDWQIKLNLIIKLKHTESNIHKILFSNTYTICEFPALYLDNLELIGNNICSISIIFYINALR